MGRNPLKGSSTEPGPQGAPGRAQVSDGSGRSTGETTEAGLWQLGSPPEALRASAPSSAERIKSFLSSHSPQPPCGRPAQGLNLSGASSPLWEAEGVELDEPPVLASSPMWDCWKDAWGLERK